MYLISLYWILQLLRPYLHKRNVFTKCINLKSNAVVSTRVLRCLLLT